MKESISWKRQSSALQGLKRHNQAKIIIFRPNKLFACCNYRNDANHLKIGPYNQLGIIVMFLIMLIMFNDLLNFIRANLGHRKSLIINIFS